MLEGGLLLLVTLSVMVAGMALAAGEELVAVTSERQLLVDDFLIASAEGLTRRFHQPVKYEGNPVLTPSHPWEGTALFLNGSVLRDPETGLLRMYYCTYETPGAFLGLPRVSFVCLAQSQDGVHWDKPFLHNVTIKGSDENNIVTEWPCCDLLQVTYDPHDPDSRRLWKLSVFQYDPRVWEYDTAAREGRTWEGPKPSHMGVCLYWSPDGLHHWVEGPKGVIPGAGDVTIAGWDAKRGKYVAYVKTGHEGKRARALAESEDFVNWPEPKLILHADEQDPEDVELYSMEGWPYESLWLGYVRTFHAKTTYNVDTQLVYSRNGVDWSRTPGRPVFLPNGPEGAWDRGYHTMSNNPPLRMGDELWIYYGSTNNTKKERPYVGGVGIAKLRVDGFASVDAGEEEGVLTTRPLVLKGTRLCVNADARGGQMTVEVVGTDGRASPGYEGEACRAITGDVPRQVVEWQERGDLDAVRDRPVVLRFRLRKARLYSFWTEVH